MNEYQQNTLGGMGITGSYSQPFSPQQGLAGFAGNRGFGLYGTPGAQFGQTRPPAAQLKAGRRSSTTPPQDAHPSTAGL